MKYLQDTFLNMFCMLYALALIYIHNSFLVGLLICF